MTEQRHRRDRPRARHEHVVLRRRALGPQRAAVPARHSRPRASSRTSSPGFEETARARDDQVHQRRPRVAGRRGLGHASSPASSRIAASRPARSASRNACASSSPTACARPRRRSQFVLATPVTAGCRMFKSPAEIALMQRANDITIEAYKAAFADAARGHDAVRVRPQRRARRSRRSARPADRPACSSASTPRSRTAASRRRS